MSSSVGQKVVCVDDLVEFPNGYPDSFHLMPKKGAIYTIEYAEIHEDNILYLGFEELGEDDSYSSDGFRPLTDILNEQSEADLARIIEEVEKEITVEV